MEINKENNKNSTNAEIYLLVQRSKKGDEQAFAELMNRYRRSVFFLIFKMVKNEEDAEDLTIEVFSKVYFNLDMYAETHSFSTWLFRIASNHAIDFLRKQKNSQTEFKLDKPLNKESNWFFELEASEPNPENQMMLQQKEDAIREIIEMLPEDIRRVVKLRIYEEMSYRDIAKKDNIAIGTVKARLYRGRILLADLITKRLKL